MKLASSRLHVGLGLACLAILAWSGWMPRDRLTWELEVAPAVLAAVLIAVLLPRWRFTPLVLVLVAIHAAILMVGGKYTYAEVPRGKWLFFIITCICLAISAFYEFIEWWVAIASGEAADAFLGTQGDVWDTQWDMFLAFCGAMVAQLMLGRWHDRQLGEPGMKGID